MIFGNNQNVSHPRLRCLREKVNDWKVAEKRERSRSGISPMLVLLFFLSCLLGYSVHLFFFPHCKAGRPVWEEYSSDVISSFLAVELGTGLLTVLREEVGEALLQPTRERSESDSASPPLLPSYRSPKGVLTTMSHNWLFFLHSFRNLHSEGLQGGENTPRGQEYS